MSVDRVATSAQTAFYLSHIQRAGSALDATQAAIASGKNATTYAGFGDQTQVLTATLSAQARNNAYATGTKFAVSQVDVQDTQLTSFASLAAQLKKAVGDAVSNNDASTLMSQAQSILEQASAILNSKDANGDYIYAGGKTSTAPVSITTMAGLLGVPTAAGAFTNGNLKKSVQVADGVSVDYGVTASDVGQELFQALRDIANFDASGAGNLNAATTLSSAQGNFLASSLTTLTAVSSNLNAVSAANGYVSNRLTDSQDQQTSMQTLYKGFVSNIQDTNMADAATQLSLNQTQLQASLAVTSTLNQISLLNYLAK